MLVILSRIFLLAICAVVHTAAYAAPAQLRNKTIILNWTNSYQQRAPDGQVMGRQIAVNRVIYVSSEGRLFERARRMSDGGMRGRSDNEPGATQMKGGEARALRFSGDRLVGSMAYETGATQYVVSFGSGFTSCSLEVVQGRSSGSLRIKGLDGRIYEILSAATSGQACSIRDGNPFAN